MQGDDNDAVREKMRKISLGLRERRYSGLSTLKAQKCSYDFRVDRPLDPIASI